MANLRSTLAITSIIPKHIYDKPGIDFNKTSFNRTPFGTGPYMVVSEERQTISRWAEYAYWATNRTSRRLSPDRAKQETPLLVQLWHGRCGYGPPEQSQVDQAKSVSGKRLDIAPSTRWWHIDLKQWGFLRERQCVRPWTTPRPRRPSLKGILRGLARSPTPTRPAA